MPFLLLIVSIANTPAIENCNTLKLLAILDYHTWLTSLQIDKIQRWYQYAKNAFFSFLATEVNLGKTNFGSSREEIPATLVIP